MHIKRIIIGASWIGALFITVLSPLTALAASATMSLSLSGTPAVGNYITISIRENSGSEPVNAARATLSYPASLLQYSSISSSSAFTIVAANSGGGGTVNVDRGALPAVSGSQTVALVKFKVLKSSGTATVNITSGQVVSANTSSDISGAKTGTSFNLQAQPPAAPAPAKDTTPPAITNVSVSGVTPNSAVINWTTSEPATSEISYGTSTSYGLAAVEGTPSTTHAVTLNSPLIQPGVTYHYLIKSTDPSGNSSTSPDATFTTTGAVLNLTVVDQNNKPLSGAKIETDNKTATTNSKGQATLDGLTIGKKYGVITYKGNKFPFTADIASADQAATANVKVKVPANYTLLTILVVLILLVIDYFIGWKTGRGAMAPAYYSKLISKIPFMHKVAGPPMVTPASGPQIQPAPGQDETIIHPSK